jgi:hypothetical protein
MAYTAQITRTNPSAILVLLDQSGSMADSFGADPSRSKAEKVADAINLLLFELAVNCTKVHGEGVRPYYEVGVIGYGPGVAPAFGGALTGRELVSIVEVADNPARVEERERDGAGGLVKEKVKVPVWFDPVCDNATPMCETLTYAKKILEPWCKAHPDSFPPMVINITDGEATDGDPSGPADDLRKLGTNDGAVLLFNLHISAVSGKPVLYPESEAALPDQFGKTLFRMSSTMPPQFQEVAGVKGLKLSSNSKGIAFNADMVTAITFLDIGTKGVQVQQDAG